MAARTNKVTHTQVNFTITVNIAQYPQKELGVMNPVIEWLNLRITQLKTEREEIESRFVSISEKKAEVEAKLRALEIGLEDARRTSGVLTPLITDSNYTQDEEQENDPRTFAIVLHKSMYNRGYFNVPRASDHLVAEDEICTVRLLLPSGDVLNARLNRKLNRNGTARIIGNAPLRDWFREMFYEKDKVYVHLVDQYQFQLTATKGEPVSASTSHLFEKT